MSDGQSDEEKSFDPADYPALREFLPAYLNQDFGEEYGSASEAVKGFVAEASGDEILQVKEEWKLFRERFRQGSFQDLQTAMKKLGSMWRPTNEAELQQWDEILSRAQI
jgi:CdiI immunity protein